MIGRHPYFDERAPDHRAAGVAREGLDRTFVLADSSVTGHDKAVAGG